ncbi:MAG: hypothetical protein IT210_26475 [Armatimonadetes bacterium]|nr:hypothetical protein [Armatimonadota bacterium]
MEMVRRRSASGAVCAAFAAIVILLFSDPASAQLEDILQGKSFGGKVIKGIAIGYAVKQASKPLNQFINAVTLRNRVPVRLATKVVPVLSVGQRAYIGGAQVVGPRLLVNTTQVVWQYEQNFDQGSYRVRAMVPSSSLNSLELRRVPKVGLSALIDVSLDNGYPAATHSGRITGDRILLAGGVAASVVSFAKPLNQFINNTVSMNRSGATKVVPQASFGEAAYIGGVQVTGSAATLPKVKVVWEYQDIFDRGRCRVRALVPTHGIAPRNIRRVEGVGVTALIDTSIARQERIREVRTPARPQAHYPRRPRTERPREERRQREESRQREDRNDDNRWSVPRERERHDNGLHRGWEIGKHKGWDQENKHKDRRVKGKHKGDD